MLKFIAAVLAVLAVSCVVSAADSDATSGNGNAVYALVCRQFGSRAAAAGIMGNIAVETGYSYSYTQRQIGGGNGYGLFQFDFLRSYYFNWLRSTGRTDSAASQVNFVWQTIYGNQKNLIGAGVASQLRTALASTSASSTASSFMRLFEKPGVPHEQQRINAANTWFRTPCPAA